MLALERPLPPLGDAARRAGRPARVAARARERCRGPTVLDGVPVRYVRFVSPPRPLSYATWGRWAAPPARPRARRAGARMAVRRRARALRGAGRRCRAALDAPPRARLPLVVSVHGGDLSFRARRPERGRAVVRRTLRGGRRGDREQRARHAAASRSVTGPLFRAGHDPSRRRPAGRRPTRRAEPTLVTVAHLDPHKNQAAVIRALAALRDRHPGLRYVVIGKGPEREALEQLATRAGRGGPGRVPGPAAARARRWRRWRAATST